MPEQYDVIIRGGTVCDDGGARVGYIADLGLVDPRTIEDVSIHEDPRCTLGIPWVFRDA